MQDGCVRRVVKRVCRWRYETDLQITRWLDRCRGNATPYVLRGHCRACGACCERPSMVVPALVYHLPTLRRLFLAWQRRVNGFELLEIERPGRVFVFRCTHFDPQTRRCDAYASRPGMCRDYPANLLDAPRPEFLPGCGHYALHPDAPRIRAELRELDVPPERLARLEREFYVIDAPEDVRRDPPSPA